MIKKLIKINLLILWLCLPTCTAYAYEDLTTWTEADTDGDITVAANLITLDAADPSGMVYTTKLPQELDGFRYRLKTKCVSNAFNRRVAIFGLSTSAGQDWTDWTDGFVVCWKGQILQLINIGGNTSDNYTLDFNTDYYLEIKRISNQIRCFIYSDEYVTLVEKLELDDFNKQFTNKQLTLMSPESGAGSLVASHSWADVSGWAATKSGVGSVTEAVTYDSVSALHCKAVYDGGTYDYARLTKDMGTFGNKIIVNFKNYYVDFGSHASNYVSQTIDIETGTYRMEVVAFPTKTMVNSIEYTLTTSTGVWYEYFLVLDDSGGYELYRSASGGDLAFIGSGTLTFSASATNGQLRSTALSLGGTVEFYQDYFNVWDNFQVGDSEIYISDVEQIEKITLSDYSYPGRAYTGDVEDVFNDLTAWSTTGSTGTVETTGGQLHITGDRGVSQAVASGGLAWCATSNITVSSIAAGCAAHLIAVTANSRNIQAMMIEDGGEYFWGFQEGATCYKTIFPAKLNTEYTVQIICRYHASAANNRTISMFVDGERIGSLADDDTIATILYGKINETAYTADAEWYADDLHVTKDRTFFFPTVCYASNGDLVLAARRADYHSTTANSTAEIFTSADDGVTWAHHQTLPVAADTGKTHLQNHLFQHGDNVYCFVNTEDAAFNSYVYKATVSGGTLGQFSIVGAPVTVAGYVLFPQIVDPDDSDKILLTGYTINLSTTHCYLITYDTSTDTFDSSGSWVSLGQAGDYTSAVPNEVTMQVNPQNTNQIIALIRWDDYTGADQLFSTYRTCTGSPHTAGNWSADASLKTDWTNALGGTPKLTVVGTVFYFASYVRDTVSLLATRNCVFKIDPSDMTELTNGYVFSQGDVNPSYFFEPGNGAVLRSASFPNKLILVIDNGTAGFFRVNLKSAYIPQAIFF